MSLISAAFWFVVGMAALAISRVVVRDERLKREAEVASKRPSARRKQRVSTEGIPVNTDAPRRRSLIVREWSLVTPLDLAELEAAHAAINVDLFKRTAEYADA